MTQSQKASGFRSLMGGVALAIATLGLPSQPAFAQVTAFKQAVAESASADRDIAAFYRETGFAPIWTGDSDIHRARRAALLQAVSRASLYGLPADKYHPDVLHGKLASVQGERALGALEVELSETLVLFSRHMQTGVLNPQKVTNGIKREAPLRDPITYLRDFTSGDPDAFFRTIVPTSAEYTRLIRAKFELERVVASGGWGALVQTDKVSPGDSGAAVVALRNRLIAMGYLDRSNSATYDNALQKAVQDYQVDQGLEPDGVAGAATLRAINVPASERLKSVLVAMERERWFNRPRGARHVLVNIPDFKARIIDNDKVTFETRSVVGKDTPDRETPEFSDVMEYMEINPYWNVPRSIASEEYLPAMRRNPYAAGHLQVIDGRGRVVPRSSINFARYSGRTFPFNLRQPPSDKNALGLVKFMFPNKYNIYLHDTPAKSLFSNEVRAFSHGCVRLNDPFDFAYELLSRQTDDPVDFFQTRLQSGQNIRVPLDEPVPVHLIYRTAYTDAKGRLKFRADIYGRDAMVYRALQNAGVALTSVQG
ncbi:MAG: L,D-transpeptidase family protein [Marinovum algicola]|uniref:L,D-transpeptidase family protein n=1 Tax=Marinovum algicola TaxID=42444 RepID=UPI0032EF0991